MRYSNTTLRELKSRYKHVLLKCAFLNAALLMGLSVATTAMAAADTTLRDAINSDSASVMLSQNTEGVGIVVNKSITVDFGGNTYTGYDSSVGSADTQSQLFQLLKPDADITFKNGTLNVLATAPDGVENFNFKMIVQNYANLTLDNMVLDGTNLLEAKDKAHNTIPNYTLSNNHGNVLVKNSTLIGKADGFAFDVCNYRNYGGVKVTLQDSIVQGNVEIDAAGDMTKAILTLQGDNTITGNISNKGGELNIGGNLILNGSINNNGTINFVNGSTLKAALNGSTVIAGKSGTITGETALVLTDVAEGASIVFEGTKDGFKFTENALYDITLSGDKYSITKKATDTIAETVISSGATEQEATAVAAVAGATSTDETVNAVLNEISTAIQEGDTKKAAAIVKAVNPEVAPVSRVAAASNAVLGAVATRMSSLGAAPAPTPATRGRSGGDVNVKLSPWVQGLYNKTHNSQADGFDAYTQGFAFGADVDLTDAWTLGIGYAYTATDVKSDRKTQIYGDNVFAYAQYKPENWYINAVASYGKSDYKQDGVFSTEYNADSYSGQLLTGYDAGLFDTYTGVRYNYIKTDAYNNGIANIKSKNTQIGTFVLGTRISQDIQVKKGFFLTPEFRLAGTYDFKSDNARSTVGIIGSTASYTVTGDRMSRGAVEAGIGLTATVNNFELKFDYDAALRSENNTQGINLKAIYHF